MRRALAIVVAAALAACGRPAPDAHVDAARAPLATPRVRMEADPPAPFTYWAPEGAVIRNHPHVPGIWLAFVDGVQVETYFGDECRASEWQHFLGQPQQSFPAHIRGVEVRSACTTCPVNSDLRRNRINVLFDEASGRIAKVACY